MPCMRNSRIFWSGLALTLGVAGLTLAVDPLRATPAEKAAARPSADAPRAAAPRPLTEDQKIVHVLNRLGFGPRPGDIERVKAMGLNRYIDLQLHPDRIDDRATDAQLAGYTMLQESSEQLAQQYNDFLGAARKSITANKAVKKQAARAMAASENAAMPTGQPTPAGAAEAAQTVPPADNAPAKKTKKALKGGGMANADPAQMQDIRAARQAAAQVAMPIAQAHEQFMAAKLVRAVSSERQLQEGLADFWNNHFNIDLRRAPCGILKIADDRDAIRPHTLGKFRDLLGASAHSPAMLVYLDNYLSTADADAMPADASTGRVRARLANRVKAAKKKRPTGLNENYAREIMELHTLGVDGGYTQNDVREVARCFTGWSVASDGARRPGQGKYSAAGAFRFNPAMHDNGAKTVLGQTIPAGGGIADGEKVLDILAAHPATMRHISMQLCQRFVSDNPPASLIDKCVATWKRTDGDLREIMQTLIASSEFYAPTAVRSKIKSPFEYAVSSARALGMTYTEAAPTRGIGKARVAMSLVKPPKGGGYLDTSETTLLGQVGAMGQPLFQYQAPTGYPEDSSKWVSAGALISRLNFALALTGGRLTDVTGLTLPTAGGATQTASLNTNDAGLLVNRLAEQILHAPIAPATRATLLKQLDADAAPATAATSGASATANRVAALLLGSPEFQRR